jgi:hypothetical protein
VEYLRQCSSTSLRYFEMSKLEHAANLQRELAVLLDEMMEEKALALLARWMLERRSSRAGGADQSGESRGRGTRRARQMLAGWLSSTRQVESASAVTTSASAKPRASAQEETARNLANPARDPSPPLPDRLPAASPAITARAKRKAERRASPALRNTIRASLETRSQPEPEGAG